MVAHSDIDHTGLTGVGGGAEFATANAKVATDEGTTSTSYTDLATPGPAVTVTVGASGKVLIHVKSRIRNSVAGEYGGVGIAVSGANTIAAATILLSDNGASYLSEWGATTMLTGLSTGSTTFTLKYIAEGSGTASFTNREITVAPVL